MPAYLDSILVAHRAAAAADRRGIAETVDAATERLASQRTGSAVDGPA